MSADSIRSTDLALLTGGAADPFPFQRELSLKPLIDFWLGDASCEGGVCTALGTVVREAVETAPELLAPITDLGVLAKHEGVVDALMAAVFPPAAWDQSLGAALMPFDLASFYETPGFKKALLGADGHLRGRVNLDEGNFGLARLRFAYKIVLERIYGMQFEWDYPLIVTTTDETTGLERYFRINFDSTFQRVRLVGERPELPPMDRARLEAAVFDVEPLLKLLPPEHFVIEGFTIVRAVDVTDQEILSSIKRDLIDRESIVSHAKFGALQAKLRTLFRRPELRFGVAAINGDQVLILNYGAELEHSCIFADSAHHKKEEFHGTVYEQAVGEQRTVIIHDLAAKPDRHPIEDQMV
jgi:hypothetical protein